MDLFYVERLEDVVTTQNTLRVCVTKSRLNFDTRKYVTQHMLKRILALCIRGIQPRKSHFISQRSEIRSHDDRDAYVIDDSGDLRWFK